MFCYIILSSQLIKEDIMESVQKSNPVVEALKKISIEVQQIKARLGGAFHPNIIKQLDGISQLYVGQEVDSQEVVGTLGDAMREIHHLGQNMENIAHPQVTKALENLYNLSIAVLKPYHEAEQKSFQTNYDALAKIAEQNGLKSIWSMGSVPATDMDKKTPAISKITYQSWGATQIHNFKAPTQITWLEFWKIADKLMQASGDSHHVFIESLYHEDKDPATHFYLSCGS